MDKATGSRFAVQATNNGWDFPDATDSAANLKNPAELLDQHVGRDLPMMRELMQVALGGEASMANPLASKFSAALADWHEQHARIDTTAEPDRENARIGVIKTLVEKLDAPAYLKTKLSILASAEPNPGQARAVDDFFIQMQAGKAVVPDHSVLNEIDGLEKLLFIWNGKKVDIPNKTENADKDRHPGKNSGKNTGESENAKHGEGIVFGFADLYEETEKEFLAEMPGDKLHNTIQFKIGVRDRLLADLPAFRSVHEGIIKGATIAKAEDESLQKYMIQSITTRINGLREKQRHERHQHAGKANPFLKLKRHAASGILGKKKINAEKKEDPGQLQETARHLATLVKFQSKQNKTTAVKLAYQFFNAESYTGQSLPERLKNPYDPLTGQIKIATNDLLDKLTAGKSRQGVRQKLFDLENSLKEEREIYSESTGTFLDVGPVIAIFGKEVTRRLAYMDDNPLLRPEGRRLVATPAKGRQSHLPSASYSQPTARATKKEDAGPDTRFRVVRDESEKPKDASTSEDVT